MNASIFWQVVSIVVCISGVSCGTCLREPVVFRSPPKPVVMVYEADSMWSCAYAAPGSWLAHEVVDEVRLWRHGGGARAQWTRRGRRLLLNGRAHGVVLTGLTPAAVAGWLARHTGWQRWVVLDARAMTPAVVRRLRRSRRLGLALVSRPGERPALGGLVGLGDRLVALSLKEATLTRKDMLRLARLKRLQALSLAGARLGVGAEAELGRIRSLRLLDLTDCSIRTLDFVRGLRDLRWLGVAGSRVSDAALAVLAGAERLRVLDLSRTAVSDFGVDRLTHLTRLRALDLADTEVTDLGLDLLAGLGDLRLLRLGPLITDTGLEHLTDLGQLRVLALRRTGISGDGLARLGALHRLRSLDLAWTEVGDPALWHLRGLTRLRHLDLGRTQVTGAGLSHLRGAHGLAWLGLRWTPLRCRHRGVLAWLRGLQRVDLTGTAWQRTCAGPGGRAQAIFR